MNIPIGDNYRIVSDPNNLILLRKRVSDPNHHFSSGVPKVSWEVEGYFGRVEHLVNRLVDKNILTSEATSLEELKKEVIETKEVLVKEISKLFNHIKQEEVKVEQDKLNEIDDPEQNSSNE